MQNIFFLFILFSTCSLKTYAQISELGLALGGVNPIADVGSSSFIRPNNLSFGFLFRHNYDRRLALKGDFTYSSVVGNDADANESNRVLRNYNFENNVLKWGLSAELNFVDFNHYAQEKVLTPFLSFGLGFILFDTFYYENDVQINNGSDTSWSIPIGIGLKSNIFEIIYVAFEVSFNYLFTDNLDGSNPQNVGRLFGDTRNNDWFVLTLLSFSIIPNRNPCFCD